MRGGGRECQEGLAKCRLDFLIILPPNSLFNLSSLQCTCRWRRTWDGKIWPCKRVVLVACHIEPTMQGRQLSAMQSNSILDAQYRVNTSEVGDARISASESG